MACHSAPQNQKHLPLMILKESPIKCRNSSSAYNRSQAMAAVAFMSSAPWRCVSRPFVRCGASGPRRQWQAQFSNLGLQPSCRMMSEGAWLRAWTKLWRKPAAGQGAQGAEPSKRPSKRRACVEFPRPSSVPFREDLANTVHLIGKVEDDVKVRVVAGQQTVANVCLAVQKSADVRVPPSSFDLLFWGSFALSAGLHLRKGDLVHVTGKVTVDPFSPRSAVRVFVQNFNWVRKSQNLGAAMAHRPWTPFPLSQHPGNNKIVEKKLRSRKDRPEPEKKLRSRKDRPEPEKKLRSRKDRPNPGQRLIKLHPKKEQAIEFGHSLQELKTMLKELEHGTIVTTLESGNDVYGGGMLGLELHARLGASFNHTVA